MPFKIRRKGTTRTRTVTGKRLLRILRRNPKQRYITAYVPPKPPWQERIIRVALSQVGVTEHPPNSNQGERVEEYQAATDVAGTGWPYCMAGVVWVCDKAGVPLAYRGAYVPSFEAWAKANGRWSEKPGRAMAGVCNFDDDPEAEHVAIVRGVSADGQTIHTIEFNTSPTATGSQANGGGVYTKSRPRSQFKGFVDLVPSTIR